MELPSGPNLSPLAVRRALPADWTAVCAILSEADDLHIAHLPDRFRKPSGPARTRERYDEMRDDPDGCLLVGERRGQVAGMAYGRLRAAPDTPLHVPGTALMIDTLAILASERRTGIGRALMSALLAWGRERGAVRAMLNVYVFNRDALEFYRALGFESVCVQMEAPLGDASGSYGEPGRRSGGL